jgi:hypothetical protein
MFSKAQPETNKNFLRLLQDPEIVSVLGRLAQSAKV